MASQTSPSHSQCSTTMSPPMSPLMFQQPSNCDVCSHPDCRANLCPCIGRYMHLLLVRLEKRRCCHCQKHLPTMPRDIVPTTVTRFTCAMSDRTHNGLMAYCSYECRQANHSALFRYEPLHFDLKDALTIDHGLMNDAQLEVFMAAGRRMCVGQPATMIRFGYVLPSK